MRGWFSRLFQSRAEALAEKAEVEGRFDDAARLFVESGSRIEAFRVLSRAAEATKDLAERRGFLARAYTVAPSEELRLGAEEAAGDRRAARRGGDATLPRTTPSGPGSSRPRANWRRPARIARRRGRSSFSATGRVSSAF